MGTIQTVEGSVVGIRCSVLGTRCPGSSWWKDSLSEPPFSKHCSLGIDASSVLAVAFYYAPSGLLAGGGSAGWALPNPVV